MESGGYIVQPAPAGPVSIKSEYSIKHEETKNSQYESILSRPDAISRAPHCSGIRMLEKVPDNPPVNTKNTIMVPCMVTKPRYILLSSTPAGAHLSPRKNVKVLLLSPGHPSWILKSTLGYSDDLRVPRFIFTIYVDL